MHLCGKIWFLKITTTTFQAEFLAFSVKNLSYLSTISLLADQTGY